MPNTITLQPPSFSFMRLILFVPHLIILIFDEPHLGIVVVTLFLVLFCHET